MLFIKLFYITTISCTLHFSNSLQSTTTTPLPLPLHRSTRTLLDDKDTSSYQWLQVGENVIGDLPDSNLGNAVAISDNGNIIAVGAPIYDEPILGSGLVRIFRKSDGDDEHGTEWKQMGQDLKGNDLYGRLGNSVGISKDGTIVAFGAPQSYDDSGHVQVFNYTNSTNSWTQLGTDIIGAISSKVIGFGCGYSLSLSDDGQTVAIGGCHTKTNTYWTDIAHQVLVYSYSNSNGDWEQVGGNIISGDEDDRFATNVALSGDATHLAIGASSDDTVAKNTGRLRVYKVVSGNWVQVGQNIDGEYEYMSIGTSVSLAKDGLTVATAGTEFVRVLRLEGSSWIQVGDDMYSGTGEADLFGSRSISLSDDGNIVAIGATQEYTKNATGYVMVMRYCEGAWRKAGELYGANIHDSFGDSLALSGDGQHLVIGAAQSPLTAGYDSNGPPGYAQVFNLEPGPSVRLCPSEIAVSEPEGESGPTTTTSSSTKLKEGIRSKNLSILLVAAFLLF
jgi:hypothetical protein